MRITGAIAVALLLAACSPATETVDEGREVADVPEAIYQPTVHAILALSGGYDADGAGKAVETVWRQAGTLQSVRMQLSPDAVTVQALNAGRYVLDSLVVDGRELLVTGDDDRKESPVNDVVLDPGEVIYGGDLIIRDRAAKKQSADRANTKSMVLRIKSDPNRARQAIADKYAAQSTLMQTRLLRKR